MMIQERQYRSTNGLMMLLLLGGALLGSLYGIISSARADHPLMALGFLVVLVTAGIALIGVFVVNPNEGKVITLFGNYVGTEKRAGLWYANPFTVRKRISLRVRNFETGKLKVNDARANPIEIGAIVVWRVIETAEASFEVDDYNQYVHVQSESALRTLASHYPYDSYDDEPIALSTHIDEVSAGLAAALRDRLAKAGVEVLEARISHLAYASEIAAAMLRRQQAGAIIAARRKIVEGAVGMVENALELLSEKGVVTLDEERKAQMVSNLLVVLCSDRDAQPVVNTGTLYT